MTEDERMKKRIEDGKEAMRIYQEAGESNRKMGRWLIPFLIILALFALPGIVIGAVESLRHLGH
jgi:hypothetical protein